MSEDGEIGINWMKELEELSELEHFSNSCNHFMNTASEYQESPPRHPELDSGSRG